MEKFLIAEHLVRDEFQTYYRRYQQRDKKHPPKKGWLLKDEYTDYSRPDGTDACPNRIACSKRNCLDRLIQQVKT
jgi:hypothetical protein